MKAILIIIAFSILIIIFCGCNQNLNVEDSIKNNDLIISKEIISDKPITAFSETDLSTNTEIPQNSDLELKETIANLLEKNQEFYEMFLFFKGFSNVTELDNGIWQIQFKNYSNFNDFKNSLYSTYIPDCSYILLNDYIGLGKTFYEDESGDVLMNSNAFGIAIVNAFRYGKDSYNFEIENYSDLECTFLFSYRLWNEYGTMLPGIVDGDDTIVTLRCKVIKENGEWKLPYMIPVDGEVLQDEQ